jgi:hypothetical protein
MIPRSLAIAAAALLITGCATRTQQQPYVAKLWRGQPITCDNLAPGMECTPGPPASQSSECVGDCTAYFAQRRAADEATKARLDAADEATKARLDADYKRTMKEAEAEDKKAAQQTAAARQRAAAREAKAAAQQAKAEQAFDAAHPGTSCVWTLGHFEIDVLDSLKSTQKAMVLSSRCSSQHKILQALGILPPDRRIEAFDRALDSAAR